MSGGLVVRSIALLVILAVFSSLWACSDSGPEEVESITIGSAPLESSALIYIAEDQGFFKEKGLNVTIRGYDTGAASFNGLLKGEVEIATPAEYPLVGAGFNRDRVRAIASIAKSDYFFLVCRRDRGIQNISDLKGKRIGVVTKTIAEFYLGRFLALHGVDSKQVNLVDIKLAQSEAAIANGDVDAIVARPPYISAIEERLGANGVIWPVQSSQALYAILIGRNDWIAERPKLVERLLKSLNRAEQFLIQHPAEARAIVQRRLNLDDAYMETVWSQNQFSLLLEQSLVVALEDEARWMINNNLTAEKTVPNFLDYIYEDALKAVKPGAVNIIR